MRVCVGPTNSPPVSSTCPSESLWLSVRPPTRSRASSTTTERPALTRLRAAVRPASPPPTIATSAFTCEAPNAGVSGSAVAAVPRAAVPSSFRRVGRIGEPRAPQANTPSRGWAPAGKGGAPRRRVHRRAHGHEPLLDGGVLQRRAPGPRGGADRTERRDRGGGAPPLQRAERHLAGGVLQHAPDRVGRPVLQGGGGLAQTCMWTPSSTSGHATMASNASTTPET